MDSSSSSFSTSNSSSSSSSSSYHPSDRSNRNVPRRKVKIPDSALKFLEGPKREQMEQSASGCGEVVCQILTQNKENRGTGFLIGPCLLITNHHILPDENTAKEGFACFFRVVSRSRSKYQETCRVETVKISLDPDQFFFTSPNLSRIKTLSDGKEVKEFLPASEGHLDFTVVAVKPAPYLSKISNFVLSVFDTILPAVNTPVCVVQCPEVLKSDDILQGDLKWSYGQIKKAKDYSITYNAPVAKGSSGGAVIDAKGNLIALHHQMKTRKLISLKRLNPIDEKTFEVIDSNDPLNVSYEYKYIGVSIQAIAACLISKGKREAMEEINKTSLPPDVSSGNVIGLPETTALFTGREKELELLKHACSGEGKRVAVVGMGGVGKTTLVVKYANDHLCDYSLICFIQSGTISQIQTGLLDLAKVLKIAEGSVEERLKALRTYFETSQERILLIFDRVDDEKTLRFLEAQIPSRGRATVLVSSCLEKSISGTNYIQLPLADFNSLDAMKFLMKGVYGKDNNQNEAAILSEKLSYFPLALAHAAAYIKQTSGCTFKKYRELLIKHGLELFQSDFDYSKNDHTILTTWQRSIDAIKEIHHCPLAEQVLQFASLLGDAHIPLELLRKQFVNQELSFSHAITKLDNYSLIKASEESVVLHSLLRKVVYHQMSKEKKENCLHDAVDVLYDCHKDLDLTLPIERWGLHSVIPHLDAVLSKIDEHKMPVDEQKIELLSKISVTIGTVADSLLGIVLNNIGECDKALTYAQRALNIRIKKLGDKHINTADSHREVGVVLGNLSRNKEALFHLQCSLDISKQQLGEDHLATADSHYGLGVNLGNLCRNEEALFHLLCALRIRKQQLGDDHLATADSYREVGVTMRNLSRNEEALFHLQRSLDISKQRLGDDHLVTADSHYCLGAALDSSDRHEEALANLRQALKIRQQQLGDDHPKVADSLYGLGESLNTFGPPEEALTYLQCALKIRQQNLGDEHPKTASSYYGLGKALDSLGKHDEAIKSHLNALEIRKKQLGDEHPHTFESYYSLGVFLGNIGRHKEALYYKLNMLEIIRKRCGENHLNTACSYREVGVTLGHLRQYENALTHLQRSLEIRKKLLGDNDLSTADSYLLVGTTLDCLERLDEAIKSYQQALEIHEKLLGKNHPTTAESYLNVTRVRDRIERYEKELADARRVLKTCKKLFGADHHIAVSGYEIWVILSKLGRYKEALPYAQSALEIWKQKLGKEHLMTADSHYYVGAALISLGEYEGALYHLRQCLQRRQQSLGEEHPDTMKSENLLSLLIAYKMIREKLNSYECVCEDPLKRSNSQPTQFPS